MNAQLKGYQHWTQATVTSDEISNFLARGSTVSRCQEVVMEAIFHDFTQTSQPFSLPINFRNICDVYNCTAGLSNQFVFHIGEQNYFSGSTSAQC